MEDNSTANEDLEKQRHLNMDLENEINAKKQDMTTLQV